RKRRPPFRRASTWAIARLSFQMRLSLVATIRRRRPIALVSLAGGAVSTLSWLVALLGLLAGLAARWILLVLTTLVRILCGLVHSSFSYVSRQGTSFAFAVPAVK